MDDPYISIHNLNDDCLLHIFKFISVSDRTYLELVCRRWEQICSLLWRTTRTFDVTEKQLGYCLQFRNDTFAEYDIDVDLTICERVLLKCFSYLTEVNLSRSSVNFQGANFMNSGHSCILDSYHPSRLGHTNFTLNSLKDPLLNCQNLENLSICYCVLDVDDEFLIRLFNTNRNLRCISVSNYHLTGECFTYLPLNTLESISFHMCDVKNKHKVPFAPNAAPKLHTLSASNFQARSNFADKMLPVSSSQLIRLKLTDYRITLQLLADICNCEYLTFLALNTVNLDDHALIRIIDSCKKLVVLDISTNQYLTDVALRKIHSLLHLKCLGIGNISNFTDDGLLTLSDNLRVLDLSSSEFRCNAILEYLKKNQLLEVLDLTYPYADRIDLEFVKSAIEIVKLRPKQIPLKIGPRPTLISHKKLKKLERRYPEIEFTDVCARSLFSNYA